MKESVRRIFLKVLGLEGRLSKLESVSRQALKSSKDIQETFSLATKDPHAFWLYLNREERMDATSPLFDFQRRAFHIERYEFAARYVKSKNVADIASGTGYGCKILLDNGLAKSVTGVEIDAEAVAYSYRNHGAPNIRYISADAAATALPPDSYDVVTSFETIEHVNDDIGLLDEILRILKPGGTFICSTPNEWPLEISDHHVREYTASSFRNILSRNFSVDEMYNQNSGSSFKYNRGQAAGILKTTKDNVHLAECFIAVCTKPYKP